MAKKKKDNIRNENEESKDVTEKASVSSKNSDYKYVIENQKVRRQAKHRKVVSVAGVVLLIAIAAVGIFYGAYTAVEINSFKVFIDSSGSKVLSLSSNSTFTYGTEQLEIGGPDIMDNTTLASGKGKNLINATPIQDRLAEILEMESFNSAKTDKFIAATFYLKNVTNNAQQYNEVMNLRSSTLNLETAVRVMLIRKRASEDYYEVEVYAKYDINDKYEPKYAEDGVTLINEDEKLIPEPVVPLQKSIYGKLSMKTVIDGDGKERVEISQNNDEAWIATDFFSNEHIFYNKGFDLAPLETIKYGIIIWLEGWDKDCVDDKLGGTIRMDFAFEQKG